jgi:sugar/nucleoside kinase (ribokinase family)
MIRVNATGCSLVDNLYGHIDFSSPSYRSLTSRSPGDGGLTTGGLVFSEALSAFAGSGYLEVLRELTGGRTPDSSNIGGPGIVPIIHAAQVRTNPDIRYRFAGVAGRDGNGERLFELLERAGFPAADYTRSDLPTPSTDVLSDPSHDGGRGERTFINTIGAAGAYGSGSLPSDFFDAEFLLFGATALVPPLHDDLNALCRRGREAGAFVMVCTVYDFRNQARMQGRPWPLVQEYGNVDLLVMDREESLRISGTADPEAAMTWFLDSGCGAVVITQGAGDVLLGTGGSGFRELTRHRMPTCRYADRVAAALTGPRDTTGCGDNFVGGVIDSLAQQMAAGGGPADLEEAVTMGIAAGSLALTCLGGVYYEQSPGDKRAALSPYLEAYREELAESAAG